MALLTVTLLPTVSVPNVEPEISAAVAAFPMVTPLMLLLTPAPPASWTPWAPLVEIVGFAPAAGRPFMLRGASVKGRCASRVTPWPTRCSPPLSRTPVALSVRA
ncbi:MAG: hypothetical protein AVDCRST_MAG85-3427 [uncultured Solirubrobacteraceae bacterium]|uniref:Uncharacterized protein n=1 Tax=uncultured Solirubrobacteraceae bacterium TaxID=1162706 RepID=A0A6J4TP05_9ACTN|nr:MAG: hypothetical protein AVDCRST_MAG85-3427 [uncultured Solirubrobacteraceae bacterium]